MTRRGTVTGMDLRVSLTEVRALLDASLEWDADVELEGFTYAGSSLTSRQRTELWLLSGKAQRNQLFYSSLASSAARMLFGETLVARLVSDQRDDLAVLVDQWAARLGEVPDGLLLKDLVALHWEPAHADAMLPRAWEPFRTEPLAPGSSSIGVGGTWVLPRTLASERAYTGPVGSGRVCELVGTLFTDEAEGTDALGLWERGSESVMGSLARVAEVVRAF